MSRHRLFPSSILAVSFLAIAFLGDQHKAAASDRVLLPKDDVVVIEIRNPSAAIDHAIVKSVRQAALTSREFRALLASPGLDRARHFKSVIEQAVGKNWRDVLETLTAGGIVASFQPGKGGQLSIVMVGESAESMQQTVKSLREKLLSYVPQAARDRVVIAATHRNRDYYKFGKAAYAVLGKRLLFANTEKRLTQLIDRVLDNSKRETSPTAAAKVTSVRVEINLNAVRKIPGVKTALQFPAKDAGAVTFLGGWLALLRGSERLNAELTFAADAIDLRLGVSGERKRIPPALAGFFATRKTGGAFPLLKPPGTIYSASWCRDYGDLWTHRKKLVTAEALKKIEEGDKQLKQQFSVIGAKARPSEMVSGLGTHFRAVVVRQKGHDYRVDLKDRLPAGAIAIELRNESAFADQAMSLVKGVGFILAVGEAKMTSRKSTHRGVELKSMRFRDDRLSASQDNRVRFQFSPTFCIAKGHFIAGSTPEVVRAVIDELHRAGSQIPVGSSKSPSAEVTTELQQFWAKQAAAAVLDFRSSIVRTLALNQGLSTSDANAEVAAFANVLKQLGEVTARVSFDENRFQYHVRFARSSNIARGSK